MSVISMQGTVTGTGAHTTASGATGAASVGYYAHDMVAKQTQGTTTTIAFALSPIQDRIATQTTTVTGGTKPGTTVTTNHYDSSSSDSPAWIDTTTTPATGTATTTWARNITGPAGSLVAQITGTGTTATNTGSYGWVGAHIRFSDDLNGQRWCQLS